MRAVFVYGTLRRGGRNHALLRSARFLGAATTVAPLVLTVDGDGIPYVRRAPGRGTPVAGELYDVDAATLARLDELEEHPHVYEREEIDVADAAGNIVRAWCYLCPEGPGEEAPGGDFAPWLR